jgi:Rrf2 family protein
MLSQRAKYTIRAMQALAKLQPGQTMQATELASLTRSPLHFLEGILLELRREGFLQSKRGRSGGYALNKPSDMITIADLIRLIDGPLALTTCASRTAYERCEDCPTPEDCQLRQIMLAARDAVAKVLEASTLAQPMAKPN